MNKVYDILEKTIDKFQKEGIIDLDEYISYCYSFAKEYIENAFIDEDIKYEVYEGEETGYIIPILEGREK